MKFDRCLELRSKLPMPQKGHPSARSPSQGPQLTSALLSTSSMPGGCSQGPVLRVTDQIGCSEDWLATAGAQTLPGPLWWLLSPGWAWGWDAVETVFTQTWGPVPALHVHT